MKLIIPIFSVLLAMLWMSSLANAQRCTIARVGCAEVGRIVATHGTLILPHRRALVAVRVIRPQVAQDCVREPAMGPAGCVTPDTTCTAPLWANTRAYTALIGCGSRGVLGVRSRIQDRRAIRGARRSIRGARWLRGC